MAALNALRRWQRWGLHLSSGLLLVTGLVWLALHYSAGPGELPHPLEAWLMRLHGAATFAALFLAGVVAAHHVPRGWRMTVGLPWVFQRRTGIALCGLGIGLIGSAYALYYFAPETLRPGLGLVHAALGVLLALLLWLHDRRRRGAARRR